MGNNTSSEARSTTSAVAGNTPSATQGWVLIATSWLAVAAPAVVAPVAPRMAAHFASDPQAMNAVQIGIGLPALFVAILAGPAGALADRVGRKRLMLGALLLYTICGVAPLWLDALPLILASRAGVGIAEAAVLATGTALISDYFYGSQREKWFAILGGSATLVAVSLIILSGALSQSGWRFPFAIYALPLLLAILVARFIWEPTRGNAGATASESPSGHRKDRLWPGIFGVCCVTLFAATAFYIVLIQLPFLLEQRGFGSASEVTLGEVAATITAPLGAILFRLTANRSVASRLAISFSASGLGMFIVVLSTDYALTLVGAAINGVGSGMALPTLMGWAMAGRPAAMIGRAAGTWNAVYALGQFMSPPLFLAVVGLTGAFASSMAVFAVALAIAAVAAVIAATTRQPVVRPHLQIRQGS